MTKPSNFRLARHVAMPLGALALAAATASTTLANDVTPLLMWGASADGAADGIDPAYSEAFSGFALGGRHGVVIMYGGQSVRGWGRSTEGQTTAPALGGSLRYTEVAAGTDHTALLRSDGTVVCVGSNAAGQCDVVDSILAYDMIRCGSNFTLVRDLNGDIVGWGANGAGAGVPPVLSGRADDFAGGLDHAVALIGDGTVVFWGDNGEGEQTQPTLGAGVTVSAVAAANNITAFLKSDGTVEVVGDNALGQLNVPALGTGQSYASVRAGGFTVGARRSDGQIVMWGNTSNDLDDAPATPADSVFDDFEIGNGFAGAVYALDCDDDGLADIVEISGDITLDCNGDLRLDSCEPGEVVIASSTVSPFGSGDTVTVGDVDLPDAFGEVVVEVEVKADLGSPGEYLTLALNGQVIDYLFLSGGQNCATTAQKETIRIAASMYNAMLVDGDAEFTLTPSSLVSETECAASSATVRFSYRYEGADCNDNGVPDSCEVVAGGVPDINNNGIPDTCELEPSGDIDGDGQGDIVWYNGITRGLSVWFMEGLNRTSGGIFTEFVPVGFAFSGMGDLDGDGRNDFVLRNTATGAVRVMLNAGTEVVESATLSQTAAAGLDLLAVVDLDRDGCADLVWRSSGTGKVFGWLMKGQVRRIGAEIGTASNATFLGAGDLDADGDADLLWRLADNTVSGWLMNGLAIQSQGPISGAGAVASQFVCEGVGDLDGDGTADMVWRSSETGDVNAWFMDGLTKSSGGLVTDTVGLTFRLAAIVDLDGDGKRDIVWRRPSNGDIYAWLMDGLTKRSGAFVRASSLSWRVVNP
ncbi:MAG: FG-GAP-like repeat-containing protein [Planctomycetota bacterium]